MKYEELIILLPCHSLEDFPLYHEGEEADGLLACWSAMWHPALLASAKALPTWFRVDDPPENLANRLVIVPSVSMQELPTGFTQRAKEEGACLIRKKHDRGEIVSLALETLDGGDGGLEKELVADFLALGFCYLQVELLTRQMRYASNLDEIHFRNQAIGAAEAAMQGDMEQARTRLTNCFDVLAEERDHYYPVDAFVLDITMVGPTTMGQSFRDELAGDTPVNLLISGETLLAMAEKEPESLSILKQAVEQNRVGLIGGETTERRLPMLSYETILAELRRSVKTYRELLGKSPQIFGRRRFGLTAGLPQVLHKLGFQGALHATLDDGRFPEGSQIKTRWEGCDGSAIDAIARAPQNANLPETFLGYAVKMGESMDTDHVATICLAHWPGQASLWLNDLRRIARHTSALGKFTTIEEYFRDTDLPGHMDRFEANQYRSPYLKQAVIRKQDDPISSSIRYWRRRAKIEASHAINTLGQLIKSGGSQEESLLSAEVDRLEEIGESETLDSQLDESLTRAAEGLANTLPRTSQPPQDGCLVFNPFSFVRRMRVDISQLADLPTVEKPVYAAAEADGHKRAVIDVPPMGFAWVTPGEQKNRSKRIEASLAEEGILRNEFFEVLINPTTGALQSLHDYGTRRNLISQQLAFRLPGQTPQAGDSWSDPDNSTSYSVMAADSVQVTASTPTYGEIVASGRLLDREGKTLAGFQQKYQIWRGSRVLLLDIELDPQVEPRSDAWNSYFASRFAWRDESANVWRSVHQTRQPADAKRIEAPLYLEIETEDQASPVVRRVRGEKPPKRATILTGGLPFHRRVGERMLDSLLIVRGERQRKFQLGIGVELSHSHQEALGLLSPTIVVPQSAPPPSPASSGWLFHLDAKNVIATHWQPLFEEGEIAGFRVRLLETAGRPARATLSSFRDVSLAQQVNFLGEPVADCQVEDGRTRMELAAGEWIEVESRW